MTYRRVRDAALIAFVVPLGIAAGVGYHAPLLGFAAGVAAWWVLIGICAVVLRRERQAWEERMELNVWEQLDSLISDFWDRGEEIGVRFETVSEAMWSGELRWTKHPNQRGEPDRSVVFYAVGGVTPEDLIPKLMKAVWAEYCWEYPEAP